MKKIILGNEILMEQPDMIHKISSYRSTYVVDSIISQIYSFQLSDSEKLILPALPDASTDIILFNNCKTNKKGIQIIGPVRQPTPSYATFSANTDFIGIRLKPGIPFNFMNISSVEMFNFQTFFDEESLHLEQIWRKLRVLKDFADRKQYIKKKLSDNLIVRDDSKTHITKYIIDYILRKKQHVTLEMLSEEMGYTPYYINKVFLHHTGYTIIQFRNLLRMHNLLNLYEKQQCTELEESQSNIAVEVGYSDQAHMIREFKRYTGITPSKFKQNYYSE